MKRKRLKVREPIDYIIDALNDSERVLRTLPVTEFPCPECGRKSKDSDSMRKLSCYRCENLDAIVKARRSINRAFARVTELNGRRT